MPLTAFVDEELEQELEKIKSGDNDKEIFPEHAFLSMCIRANISIEYLTNFTYVDIMKIILCLIDKKDIQSNNATQSDIDKLLR